MTVSTRPLRREPEPPKLAGLLPREALQILRGLAGVDIIGGDVVEIAPQYDATTNTAQIAAQVLFELLCLVALKGWRRGGSYRSRGGAPDAAR